MQHKQFNFVRRGAGIAALTLPLVVAGLAVAASIPQPSKPDPLLDGGPSDPCAAGVDYAQGLDANGKAVITADVESRPVPVPDSIAIPLAANRQPGSQGKGPGNQSTRSTGGNPAALGGDSTYISLDGRKLEPLLNPPPCTAVH